MRSRRSYQQAERTEPTLPAIVAIEVELSTDMIEGLEMRCTLVRADGRDVLRTWSSQAVPDLPSLVDVIHRTAGVREFELTVKAIDPASDDTAAAILRLVEPKARQREMPGINVPRRRSNYEKRGPEAA